MLTSINSRFINSLITVEKPETTDKETDKVHFAAACQRELEKTQVPSTTLRRLQTVDNVKRIRGRIKYGTAARY